MRTFLSLLFLFTVLFSSAQNNSELSKETLDEITNFIKQKREYYNSPSVAVAITDEHKTVYLKHFGDAKKGDRYLIGSISKSFTALLILRLQEEGKLHLQDPVSKYLPWFRYKNKQISDKITIEDLLRHTSGISTEMGRTFKTDTSFSYEAYYANTLRELAINNVPAQPFRYSNVNYRLLGLIIEKVTHKTYEECLESYVTSPLELHETSANTDIDLINSYQYFLYYPILKFNADLHPQEASSGLISSSAGDMARYLRHIMNSYHHHPNSKLNSNTVTQLVSKKNNNKSFYGLGWFINNDSSIFYHGGTNKSFESHMYILPSLKKAIVVLINSNQAPDVEIINGIYGILLGKGYYNNSSFAYYRHLPFLVFLLFILFLFQIWKWKKSSYPKKISRKIVPNILVSIGLLLALGILIYIPKLNGVSLQTSIEFDPASGYSIIFTSLLLAFSSILIYFNSSFKSKS
ncbi:serine hydrolase domain-containing protein [uncultured Tenacibaculum sp.]|uniref:serine hydrolase domain-containing protein n=1 Tax=uncultured Tenacibaculum sp. TaxID=174713 RepID=UPI002619797B|nr:serine hydrolase domain-containing protein [uncultured Tenacibaculum sp.]